MKTVLSYLFITGLLVSCSHKEKEKRPDISKIMLSIRIQRFDRDFFAIDTNNINEGLAKLKEKYGTFLNDFLYNILAIAPGREEAGVKHFVTENKTLYQDVQSILTDLSLEIKAVESGLKRIKYYFPEAKIPDRIILFTGPTDGYGCLVAKDAIAIGLQQYLGADYLGYHSSYMANLFPADISRKFAVAYIATDALRKWLQSYFPVQATSISLADRMVEEGRFLYVLRRLLPEAPDTVITGYAAAQLKWCHGHESEIRHYFAKDSLWETRCPETILQYTSEQVLPLTQTEKFPPNIGRYIGWKIVEHRMREHPETTLPELMKLPAQTIWDEERRHL